MFIAKHPRGARDGVLRKGYCLVRTVQALIHLGKIIQAGKNRRIVVTERRTTTLQDQQHQALCLTESVPSQVELAEAKLGHDRVLMFMAERGGHAPTVC